MIWRLILAHFDNFVVVEVELLGINRDLDFWRLVILARFSQGLQWDSNFIQMVHDFDQFVTLLLFLVKQYSGAVVQQLIFVFFDSHFAFGLQESRLGLG